MSQIDRCDSISARPDAGPGATLLLGRGDVRALLGLDECIAWVERALRLAGQGRTLPSSLLGVHAPDGGFHVKAALLDLGRPYFVAKTNANFPGNPARFGLPSIQGVIAVCDAETGALLALMDSMEITLLRTGAATAVAARHLAPAEAPTATIAGCGQQGRVQLRALARVRRLQRVHAFDEDAERAHAFARDLGGELGLSVAPVTDLAAAVRRSQICVTCTPSRRALVRREDVGPGTFIAAVGADSEGKQELDPALLAAGTVVVDSLEQCAVIGELQHALARGLLARADVHAELADVVAGRKPGRTSAEEITIFDSTGIALEDAAAAAAVLERARATGAGRRVDLGA